MTTRVHTELRKLALAYYRGWITRDKYLSIRQEYLQSITNDEVPAAINPKKIAPPKKKTKTGGSGKSSSGNKMALLISLIAIVLLLIVIGIYFSTDSEPQKPAPPSTINDAPEPVVETLPQPLTDEQRFTAFLSDNFINQRTWEQDALNSLKLKWLGLSQEQQKTVRESNVFREFSGVLIERIVDERKLNNIVPSDYEMALMTAAKNMGLINAIPDQ